MLVVSRCGLRHFDGVRAARGKLCDERAALSDEVDA
jgi:hypothetical protein